MLSANRFTFCKEERLCSKKIIQSLFARKGVYSTSHYPIMGLWLFGPVPTTQFPAQVLFSVPKKKFKKAHDRNRIRRQMREAYRLQKTFLYQMLLENNVQCAIVLTYTAREHLPYQQIENATISILKRIIQSYRPGDGTAADRPAEGL